MPVKVGLKYIEKWKESMENEVLAYEKEPIEKGQIVFYGPSNFTRWSQKWGNVPMRDVLLGGSGRPCVINRGFGSSCAEHQLYYYPRLIRPLEPKVLVYSCIGNGEAFGYSDEEMWELAQRVIAYARTDFPDIRIYLCGPKGKRNISEEEVRRRKLFGSWIKQYVEETPNCFYIETLEDPRFWGKDLYIADGTHFTPEGYRLYGELFREALAEELAQF